MCHLEEEEEEEGGSSPSLNFCLWVCPNSHTCVPGHLKLIVLNEHYIHISNTASEQFKVKYNSSKSRDVKKNSLRKII